MKQIIEVQGETYKLRGLIQDRFGLNNYSWETLGKRGLLPPAIKLGRWRYYSESEFEALLVGSMNLD